MSLFLSCGPIFEPVMGILCSTVTCIGLVLYFGIKFFKGEKYKEFKSSSGWDKTFEIILFIVIKSAIVFLLWWVLVFVFAGITFWITDNLK